MDFNKLTLKSQEAVEGVRVDAKDGELSFEKAAAAEPAAA